MAYKYYDDEKLIIDEVFKKLSETNKYGDILDKYILEKFDVEVLPFDSTTLIDKNHPYELHPSHYEPKYYLEKTRQLNKIINRYDIFDYEYKLNCELRSLQRKNIIFNLNSL